MMIERDQNKGVRMLANLGDAFTIDDGVFAKLLSRRSFVLVLCRFNLFEKAVTENRTNLSHCAPQKVT